MHCRCLCWFVESIDHWKLRPNCNFVLQNCRLWKKGTCVNNISRPGSNLLNMLLDSFAHVVCGSMHYFHGCRRRISSAIDIHWFHSEALEKVEKEFHQHQPALISVILRHPPHLDSFGHFCKHVGFAEDTVFTETSREVQFGHVFASFIFPDHTFVYQLPWRSCWNFNSCQFRRIVHLQEKMKQIVAADQLVLVVESGIHRRSPEIPSWFRWCHRSLPNSSSLEVLVCKSMFIITYVILRIFGGLCVFQQIYANIIDWGVSNPRCSYGTGILTYYLAAKLMGSMYQHLPFGVPSLTLKKKVNNCHPVTQRQLTLT